MKKLFLVLTIAAGAQTLNVQVGNVTYQFPATQTGEMTYSDGTTLTIMGKEFTISGGTEYFGGLGNIGGTVSGGSTVSLSEYTASGNGQGGGGDQPGGGGDGPGGGGGR